MNIDCCKSYVGKQIIGLLPDGGGPPTCLFTAGYFGDSTGDYCFTDPGWDFNGQGIDFTAAASLFGGYAIQTGNTGSLPYGGDLCSIVIFSYIGTVQPPDVNVVDPIFGNFQLPLNTTFCEYGCLTTGSILLKDTYFGINMVGYVTTATTPFGFANIDFVNDLPTAEFALGKIMTSFYPGSNVNVTADGLDYFTITFNGVYYNSSNLTIDFMDNSGLIAVTSTLVPC